MMKKAKIENVIRDIPDFPKPGILFKDITPFLNDGALFAEYIDAVAERYQACRPTAIAVIESRGFIFGSALAYKLKCGIVPIRKKGKLPWKTHEMSYDLEYGQATVEIHQDAFAPGDKVVLIDDLLATGGTALAAVQLVEKLQATIIGIEFLIELVALGGREKLAQYPINVLMRVE